MADSFVPRGSSGVLVPRGFCGDTYEAARPSRKRQWLPEVQTDSSRVLTPYVLRSLRAQARVQFARSGFVRGAFIDVARYMIGHNGIRPHWESGDDGWDQEMELRWKNWLKICDIRRKLTGNQMFRSASIEMDCDGDFGFILTQTGGGDMERPGMAQLQTVRAHRIDDAQRRPGDPESRAGVIADRTGRVRAYRVLEGDNGKYRDIPAQSFVLLGDPELSDWTRYPTAIAHGLNLIQDGAETMEHVRQGIKARTARAFFRRTASGEADDDDLLQDENGEPVEEDGISFEELISGEIPRLGPDEDIVELQNQYPGEMLIPMLEFDRRDFALGYGTPLEAIYKSDLGGPAQRFFLSKFQRKVDERRGLVFVPLLMHRVASFFAACEIRRGAMPHREVWWPARHVPTSPTVTIDVGREAQQNREDMKYGNRTLETDAGDQGSDWEEIREQIERETDDLLVRGRRIAKKHDITLEQALSLLSQRTSGSQSLNLTELIAPRDQPARPVED